MHKVERVYDAEDALRAKLERHGITGGVQTILYHLIRKGFFVLCIVFVLTLFAFFGGLTIGKVFIGLVVLLLCELTALVYIYTRAFRYVPQKEIPKTDIITYEREPNSDELVLGYADGVGENGEPIRVRKGIPQEDRKIHHYIVGGSGVGKSRFIQSIIIQDIKNKVGFAVIDPHSDLFESTLGYLALTHDEEWLQNNVVVLDPTNPTYTATFNPIQPIEGISSAEIANELVFVFQKVWADSWGNRTADMIRASVGSLSEAGMTLNEIPQLLTDKNFRAEVLSHVKNETWLNYFHNRYEAQPVKVQMEWAESVLNKMNMLLSDDRIKHIFGAQEGTFNIRDIMDSGKILLVKLDQGRLKDAANTLGALITSAFQMAAYSRSNIPLSERRQFYLYIDEFQSMASESFTQMLGEARKYAISLILAHQDLAQVSRELSAGVMANCGIHTYFRLSRDDANRLSKESLLALYQEEPSWETLTQVLQVLRPRMCFVHSKREGGVIQIETLDTPLPHELVDLPVEIFQEYVSELMIGKKYLRTRADVESEIQARKEGINEKDSSDEEDPVSFWEKER